MVVPVTLPNGKRARFAFDTGAGLDVVSSKLAKELSLNVSSKFTGHRMSGEEITLDLATISALQFAGLTKSDWTVGITDIFDKLPPELAVDGAISLRYLADLPFTIDFPQQKIRTDHLLDDGEKIDVDIVQQGGLSLGILAPVSINSTYSGNFEVDTGTTLTIAPPAAMTELSIDQSSEDVKHVEGTNETGVPYERFYTNISTVAAADNEKLALMDRQICFEKIVYDGVIGTDYLGSFVVSFDLPNLTMFMKPSKKV